MTIALPLEELTRLLSEKPELAAALGRAASVEEAAGTLARAAAQRGIAVDTAQLAALLAEKPAPGALSDDDLDRINGGISLRNWLTWDGRF